MSLSGVNSLMVIKIYNLGYTFLEEAFVFSIMWTSVFQVI